MTLAGVLLLEFETTFLLSDLKFSDIQVRKRTKPSARQFTSAAKLAKFAATSQPWEKYSSHTRGVQYSNLDKKGIQFSMTKEYLALRQREAAPQLDHLLHPGRGDDGPTLVIPNLSGPRESSQIFPSSPTWLTMLLWPLSTWPALPTQPPSEPSSGTGHMYTCKLHVEMYTCIHVSMYTSAPVVCTWKCTHCKVQCTHYTVCTVIVHTM